MSPPPPWHYLSFSKNNSKSKSGYNNPCRMVVDGLGDAVIFVCKMGLNERGGLSIIIRCKIYAN